MAVRLRDDVDTGEVGQRPVEPARAARRSVSSRGHLDGPRASVSSTASLRRVGQAGRLQPDDRHAADSTYGASVATVRSMIARAWSSWPVVIQVSPQQASSGITRAVSAGRRRAPGSRRARSREEVVGERVRPDPHVRRGDVRGARRDLPQRRRRERRERPALVDAGGRPWPAGATGPQPHHPVGHRRHRRGQRGPLRQPAEQCSGCAAGARRRPAYCWCSASALYVAMSTPVGQSDAQPLQARQRSSASARRGRRARCTSEPSSASWSTRARPRVESFSSRVARYDGHITPLVVGATHLPTPVQRCTASPSEPPSWISRSRRDRARGRAGAGRRPAAPGRR